MPSKKLSTRCKHPSFKRKTKARQRSQKVQLKRRSNRKIAKMYRGTPDEAIQKVIVSLLQLSQANVEYPKPVKIDRVYQSLANRQDEANYQYELNIWNERRQEACRKIQEQVKRLPQDSVWALVVPKLVKLVTFDFTESEPPRPASPQYHGYWENWNKRRLQALQAIIHDILTFQLERGINLNPTLRHLLTQIGVTDVDLLEMEITDLHQGQNTNKET